MDGLFDHVVGSDEERRWDFETENLRGPFELMTN
jgi:hypothetical protein